MFEFEWDEFLISLAADSELHASTLECIEKKK